MLDDRRDDYEASREKREDALGVMERDLATHTFFVDEKYTIAAQRGHATIAEFAAA